MKCVKRKFRTELDAKIVLMKRRARDKGEKRVYYCAWCRTWHLTSQGKREWK